VLRSARDRGRGDFQREYPHKTRSESVNQAAVSVISGVFLQNPCRIALNFRLFRGHFVHVSFVFIHIPALNVIIFIFPARPAPDFDFLLV
jgi:hypothetical protein